MVVKEEAVEAAAVVEAAPVVTAKSAPSRYPSRAKRAVKLKLEDHENGLVRCPRCQSGVSASETGCNIVTCFRLHPETLNGTLGGGRGGWVHFCFHCGEENNGEKCGGAMCPSTVTRKARVEAREMRNDAAAANPVDLM